LSWSLAIRLAAGVGAAYLLGAIPWALVVGKHFYGIDVRREGSGNLGATNVMRVLGWKAALATLVLDVAKGALAVLVAWALVPVSQFGAGANEWAMIVATMAAILGHSFSPYIGFKGGKGVATAAGALLIVTPLAWPILLVSFVVVVLLGRMVSLGSIIIAVEYPILVWFLYPGDRPRMGLAVVAACLVILRHSANIRRIVRGDESRLSLKSIGLARKKGGS
jgi:glycerol-3-phosphate acyltransferase PlsY